MLMILAIVLIVGVDLALRSVSETKMGLQKIQSSQTYYLAALCAEQALMKLKEDNTYGGNETIDTEDGSCQILPVEGSWTIKISASSSAQIKKIKIIASQVNPVMIIDSWQEVAEF